MRDEALFLYGTLRHAPLLAAVAGQVQAGVAATLAGHAVTHAVSADGQPQDFPLCAPQPGAIAQGLLIRPDAAARDRIDSYERVFGYETARVTVQTDAGDAAATLYRPRAGLWRAGAAWSLEHWVAGPGTLAPEVAAEVMTLLQDTPAEAIRERFPMLEIRASSRRRARAEPAPSDLRRRPGRGDVEIDALRRPYSWFFGVEEADLRFRRFDGAFSPLVRRAGFIIGDAVTVLPYDPGRDAVMLVEQFRFGPYARGDSNPWSLEPIAGRIDPFESPECAARREADEEASLALSVLHRIGRYYVSPGAVSEYLISFVGIADLPASAMGVGGLDAEAEDIRAHVIPFSRLMALLESGEAENGPLLISAQWLALNRERLREAED